jgi:hypothetical protein
MTDHPVDVVNLKEDMPDKPPLAPIVVVVLLAFTSTAVVGIMAYYGLWLLAEKEIEAVDTGMGNQVRLSFLKEQNAILSGQPLEKPLEAIPGEVPGASAPAPDLSIDEAMDLLLKHKTCDLKKYHSL